MVGSRIKALEQGHHTNHHRHQVIQRRSQSLYDEINIDADTFEMESSSTSNQLRQLGSASATERFIGGQLQARADLGKRGHGLGDMEV